MKHITKLSLVSLLITVTQTIHAQEAIVPKQWKTECVGYFQISLPGEIEVALMRYGTFLPNHGYWFSKNIDQRIFYASTNHDGKIGVYPEDKKEAYKKGWLAEVDRIEKYRTKNKETVSTNILPYSFPDENSFLVRYGSSKAMEIKFSSYHSDRLYTYETNDLGKLDGSTATTKYRNFSDNFRPRALYEIPNENGVCIPYGFIKSDVPQDRVISSAMRLKNHPDVTVLLMDKSASWGGFVKKESPTEVEEIRYLWEQGFTWRTEKIQALGFPRFPLVNIAGYKGRSSFVEITRPNPAPFVQENVCTRSSEFAEEQALAKCPPLPVDYGYVAYVKGDPTAKEDAPNLMLYVLQESKYGPDGKPTISRDELRKMADAIAASIKRH